MTTISILVCNWYRARAGNCWPREILKFFDQPNIEILQNKDKIKASNQNENGSREMA
jgi:hypothetical protein